MSPKDNRSLDEIEKDIARNRDSLAATIDELAFRVKPGNIAKRQAAEAKGFFDRSTRNNDGSLRLEVIAPVAGAAVLLIALAIANRVRG